MKVDTSNECGGHLRFGLARVSNLSNELERGLFSMFLGHRTDKSDVSHHLYRNQYVISPDITNCLPDDSKLILHNAQRWKDSVQSGCRMGYLFDRRKSPISTIYIFINEELIAELSNVPLENPLEWIPAFSVGPLNQITLSQDIHFDVFGTLLDAK